MNVQEYISSGIVESYVLGLAGAAEREEFEKMCDLYPEVRAARDAFEASFEEQAMRSELKPPQNLKSKIFSNIELEAHGELLTGSEGTRRSPVVPITSGRPVDADGRSLPGSRKIPAGFQRMIAVAAVVLLVLSTMLNLYFFNRYREFSEKYQALVLSQTELASHNQVLQTRLLDFEKAVEMMKDPAMAVVKMPAIPGGPDPTSATVVYWDTATRDVYLAVSKLPAPSAGQQYQLWAMVDGKPVDAGVFDMKEGAGMFKMKNIPRAEAFAITLERRGGSPTPSLDKLYVMGKV